MGRLLGLNEPRERMKGGRGGREEGREGRGGEREEGGGDKRRREGRGKKREGKKRVGRGGRGGKKERARKERKRGKEEEIGRGRRMKEKITYNYLHEKSYIQDHTHPQTGTLRPVSPAHSLWEFLSVGSAMHLRSIGPISPRHLPTSPHTPPLPPSLPAAS